MRSARYQFHGQPEPEPVALKIFKESADRKQTVNTVKAILEEVRIGARLRHPNCIRLFGFVKLRRGRGSSLALGSRMQGKRAGPESIPGPRKIRGESVSHHSIERGMDGCYTYKMPYL